MRIPYLHLPGGLTATTKDDNVQGHHVQGILSGLWFQLYASKLQNLGDNGFIIEGGLLARNPCSKPPNTTLLFSFTGFPLWYLLLGLSVPGEWSIKTLEYEIFRITEKYEPPFGNWKAVWPYHCKRLEKRGQSHAINLETNEFYPCNKASKSRRVSLHEIYICWGWQHCRHFELHSTRLLHDDPIYVSSLTQSCCHQTPVTCMTTCKPWLDRRNDLYPDIKSTELFNSTLCCFYHVVGLYKSKRIPVTSVRWLADIANWSGNV